jgi:hypothetical protein
MTSGTLTFSRFIVGDIFCCVEDVEEIEDLTVFGVLAVCEELGVFFDGVITFSFGFSVSSIQVNNVCASTELKTRLVDSEDESVSNLTPNDSPSSMD